MNLELKLSIKNLLGAKLRTLLNVLVLSISFVVIILLNSIMDGWDAQAKKDSIEWEFGKGQLLHNQYDPNDFFSILDGHGQIPENDIGLTPVFVHQATIYPQNRMMNTILKGADPNQKTTLLPTHKLLESKALLPAIIGKRMAEATNLKIGDELLVRWRDKNGAFDAAKITIVDVFNSNVPAIDLGQIWISIETLWSITGHKYEATLFIASDSFVNTNLDSWKFTSQKELLQNITDLVSQKKTGQSIVYLLLMGIALLAIFDTQVLSIYRRQKEIGTYIALGMTRLRVVRLFTLEGSIYSFLALILGGLYGSPLFYLLSKFGFPVPPADQKMGLALAETIIPVYSFKLVLGTVLLVLISATIVSYLPARKIAKLNPALALKGKQQ